jgi:F-type H+-transporting ATPase subunit b
LEQLGINLGFLLSQMFNFGAIALLLYVLLYKPVLNMLHERQARISRAMQDAEAARNSAAEAQQEFDRRVQEAQRKAQEIIAQAAQASEKVGVEIKAEAQREAEQIRERARAEAAQERDRILADVQKQIASLSMLATERVLGQGMDENVQRRLIGQFLNELGDRPLQGDAHGAASGGAL